MSELLADDAELLSGLTEAFDVLLTHGTNQIIKVLTVFSVLLLPMTLLTGLYGMNVALPFEQAWWTFGLIIGIMLFVSVAMVVFFKYKRWIWQTAYNNHTLIYKRALKFEALIQLFESNFAHIKFQFFYE